MKKNTETKVISLKTHLAEQDKFKHRKKELAVNISQTWEKVREDITPELLQDLVGGLHKTAKIVLLAAKFARCTARQKIHDKLSYYQFTAEDKKEYKQWLSEEGDDGVRNTIRNTYVALQLKDNPRPHEVEEEVNETMDAINKEMGITYNVAGDINMYGAKSIAA